jgi:hypothetical protein
MKWRGCVRRRSWPNHKISLNLPGRWEIANKLTPWSWILLEKLPVAQLLKNFQALYANRRFITVFTRALHWSLCWARSIQSISPHCLSKIHLNIILELCLGLPGGLFLSGFQNQNPIYIPLLPMHATDPVHPILLDLIIIITGIATMIKCARTITQSWRLLLTYFWDRLGECHKVYLHILEKCTIRLKSCWLQHFYPSIGHSSVRATKRETGESVRQPHARCHDNRYMKWERNMTGWALTRQSELLRSLVLFLVWPKEDDVTPLSYSSQSSGVSEDNNEKVQSTVEVTKLILVLICYARLGLY